MGKRTQESWYVGAQNDALFIIDKPPRPSNDDINPDQDVEVIAKVYSGSGEEDERARLLAAAPDLLEAWQELIESRVRVTDGIAQVSESAIGKVRAAVRKATGESSPP